MKKTKKRTLPTMKQKKFVRRYLEHGNGKRAVLESYETKNPNSAAVMAHTNLQRPEVQNYMAQILDEAGLTDDYIASGLYKITQAGLSEKSLKKVAPQDSLRAFELGLKLRDRFPAERKRVESLKVNVDLSGKTTEELQELLGKKLEEGKHWLKTFKDGKKKKDREDGEKKLVAEAVVVETAPQPKTNKNYCKGCNSIITDPMGGEYCTPSCHTKHSNAKSEKLAAPVSFRPIVETKK